MRYSYLLIFFFLLPFKAYGIIEFPSGYCLVQGTLALELNPKTQSKSWILTVNSGSNSEVKVAINGKKVQTLVSNFKNNAKVRSEMLILFKSSKMSYRVGGFYIGEFKIIDPFDELDFYEKQDDIEKNCFQKLSRKTLNKRKRKPSSKNQL